MEWTAPQGAPDELDLDEVVNYLYSQADSVGDEADLPRRRLFTDPKSRMRLALAFEGCTFSMISLARKLFDDLDQSKSDLFATDVAFRWLLKAAQAKDAAAIELLIEKIHLCPSPLLPFVKRTISDAENWKHSLPPRSQLDSAFIQPDSDVRSGVDASAGPKQVPESACVGVSRLDVADCVSFASRDLFALVATVALYALLGQRYLAGFHRILCDRLPVLVDSLFTFLSTLVLVFAMRTFSALFVEETRIHADCVRLWKFSGAEQDSSSPPSVLSTNMFQARGIVTKPSQGRSLYERLSPIPFRVSWRWVCLVVRSLLCTLVALGLPVLAGGEVAPTVFSCTTYLLALVDVVQHLLNYWFGWWVLVERIDDSCHISLSTTQGTQPNDYHQLRDKQQLHSTASTDTETYCAAEKPIGGVSSVSCNNIDTVKVTREEREARSCTRSDAVESSSGSPYLGGLSLAFKLVTVIAISRCLFSSPLVFFSQSVSTSSNVDGAASVQATLVTLAFSIGAYSVLYLWRRCPVYAFAFLTSEQSLILQFLVVFKTLTFFIMRWLLTSESSKISAKNFRPGRDNGKNINVAYSQTSPTYAASSKLLLLIFFAYTLGNFGENSILGSLYCNFFVIHPTKPVSIDTAYHTCVAPVWSGAFDRQVECAQLEGRPINVTGYIRALRLIDRSNLLDKLGLRLMLLNNNHSYRTLIDDGVIRLEVDSFEKFRVELSLVTDWSSSLSVIVDDNTPLSFVRSLDLNEYLTVEGVVERARIEPNVFRIMAHSVQRVENDDDETQQRQRSQHASLTEPRVFVVDHVRDALASLAHRLGTFLRAYRETPLTFLPAHVSTPGSTEDIETNENYPEKDPDVVSSSGASPGVPVGGDHTEL